MKILADVDTGIDDAIALAYLVGEPDAELLAVTTTAGNTTAEQAAVNSAAVLQLCGRTDVEVAVGRPGPLKVPLTITPETHGPTGLGYAELPALSRPISGRDHLEVWLEHLHAHPGEVTLLVTGPLTNLAYALRREPDLLDLIGRVVIMGGAYNHPGNTTPTAEWNSWVDPHAAAEVFAAYEGRSTDHLPIVCSLGVTERLELSPAELDRLVAACGGRPPRLGPDTPRDRPTSATGHPVTDLITGALRFYYEFHTDWGYGYTAQLHDLLAAQVAVGAVSYAHTTTWVGVETDSELTRGTTVADLRKLWPRMANARLVTDTDSSEVIEQLTAAVQRLSSLSR